MHTLEEGQKFERYRIVRPSGSGATGSSYEAEDTRHQRTVFLKIIHPWTLLPDAARRQFFREMQTIGSLSHPPLAPILNYGEWHGQLFVARIYTRYGSLINEQGRTWFRPPMDIQNVVTYTTQIANALTNIHNIGYAHGSLTLSNILINQEPTISRDSPFLIADAALGTFVRKMGQPPVTFFPMTVAPEQFAGQTTPASDQYALAVLLYLWLAGRPPFLGTPEEIRTQKSQGIIPSLLPFNANITYELENIIRRALSASPGHRFASINTFVQALQKVLYVGSAQARSFKHKSDALVRAKQKPVQPNTEPIPRIEPDTPQPIHDPAPPTPAPVREPNPEEPLRKDPGKTTPDPLPSEPLPAEPDIAQPVPDATPFTPPEIEPGKPAQPKPKPAPDPRKEDLINTEPLQAVIKPAATTTDTYLVITPPLTHEHVIYPLIQPETTLGHAGSSDVLLDHDESTSRHHAIIRAENRQYWIHDCSSASGVFVNGQKLIPEQGQLLDNGDEIAIGKYALIFYSNQPASHLIQQKEQVLS
ncbi:protein kinase domain-containing protein [Dictyobacter formicarum]|uniref:non-specific serine/threonine protein kinase n=1 Tax=Dictyobacter formicarum TaxID=2778368 RepID=A0ABQ3VGB0_9CHLR|nr:FHA domain-containing protein [Dictyobacter formicarum]GHO84853.1 hypothetical protein KSZ_28590 [Dictyobacter formicarum]